MSQFLDLIESYERGSADVHRIFGGEGSNVSARARSGRNSPQYMTMLNEAVRMVARVRNGTLPARMISEAMSTADFPQLFGDIIDRAMLAKWRETTPKWSLYAKRSTVRDFRQAKLFSVTGAEAPLEQVAQNAPYPASKVEDSEVTRQVYKFGRRLPFTWETFINDDLSALTDGPDRLMRAARRTIDLLATRAHVDASGPHASVFTVGNANIITGNPALSLAGLQTGISKFAGMLDSEGYPIEVEGIVLEVPPALEVLALNILNATEIHATAASLGGGSGIELRAANWMTQKIRLVVNPYIPLVASSANGSTTWFIHADHNVTGRPGVQVDFLAGHEEPETFMKSANARRVGGGDVDPFEGDFESDAIEYKVRLVTGATVIEPKAMVSSNGSGS